MQCSGLGGMQINTVGLPWNDDQISTSVDIIRDAIVLRKNVLIFRHAELMKPIKQHTIDIWLTKPEGCTVHDALAIQLAYILHSNRNWKRNVEVRLLKLVEKDINQTQEHEKLTKIALDLRLRVRSTNLLILSQPTSLSGLNLLMQRHSATTCQVFLSLSCPPKSSQEDREYWNQLDSITKNLPSTVLVRSAEGQDEFFLTCI